MDTLGSEQDPKARLLLVEDHETFASVMSRMLHDHGGYEADIAGTAEEALPRALDQDYDLVLIDISLPARDGIWLGDQLHQRRPDQRFLMVSGHDETEVVRSSLAVGARGYILKDDVPGLLEGVQAVLRGEMYVSRALTSGAPSSDQIRVPARSSQPSERK